MFVLFIVIDVSSAYNIMCVSIELINKCDMSLMYRMNSSGPRIGHWGNPISYTVIEASYR